MIVCFRHNEPKITHKLILYVTECFRSLKKENIPFFIALLYTDCYNKESKIPLTLSREIRKDGENIHNKQMTSGEYGE